ncbi:MAG: redox-sensing transcriptional repressor Rex [Chitinispirillaceae bacterium]|nr:redox-sensing transcriptional repressor Rex [Chitinispirillaceae bacterium]
MKTIIPEPTIIRLCTIHQFLTRLEQEGVCSISSPELEKRIGFPSHTIRKDINYLGEIGSAGAGYDVTKLKNHVAAKLEFQFEQKACVVGLGNLGQALLHSPQLAGGSFSIVAGFDSNVNKLETIKTDIPLFPSHEIVEVVRRMNIGFAIIAVPPQSAQEVTDRLVDGGITGIVSFAHTIINPKKQGVFVRNIDIGVECRILSVLAKSRNDAP